MKANALKELKKSRLMENELASSVNIPFAAHVSKKTIKNHTGDYLRVFRLEGIAHESADDEDINVWHEQLNILLRNLATTNLALWTHVVRRRENTYPSGVFPEGFANDLNERYRREIINGGKKMLVNELYITVVYRPYPDKISKTFAVFEKNKQALLETQQYALERLDEVEDTILKSLDRYSPETLGTYDYKGILHSEILEFFGFLVNGEWQRMPVPTGNIRKFIGTSRLFFGSEAIAMSTPVETIHGAMLGIKEYPPFTGSGMLDEILALPCELILTQSFIFKDKQSAKSSFERQADVMIQAGDLAESQIADLQGALDDLISNRFVIGEYHLSLFVLSRTQKELMENIGLARTALSETGMVVAREDLANEAAFWAQLPGNFEFRTRPALVTSRNFAGLSAFHNYPQGKRNRNHWGDAVALLRTSANSPYYFNFHKHDLANTLIIGPSGSGKTVVQLFALCMLMKFKPRVVFYDKDFGAKIFVHAMGGQYHSLELGKKTGWNPFQLEPNERNIDFLEKLIRLLVKRKDVEFTVKDERAISAAVRGVLALDKADRRMFHALSFFDPTDPEGIYYRLEQWCEGHRLGWVFDNATDNLDMTKTRVSGFDMTQLLDSDDVKAPALLYLTHRQEELINGEPFVAFYDEFWRLVIEEILAEKINDKLKVIRKQNGFLVMGTQSPKDALNSPIAYTLIEQSPTQIFMPNPKGTYEDYVEGFHLSEKEFEIVKTLPEGSRRFLIKQGHNSVVAELNLKGFGDELAVLSGNTANAALVDRIIDEVGADPKVWLPIFHERRKLL